jgi:hypothetical protein
MNIAEENANPVLSTAFSPILNSTKESKITSTFNSQGLIASTAAADIMIGRRVRRDLGEKSFSGSPSVKSCDMRVIVS